MHGGAFDLLNRLQRFQELLKAFDVDCPVKLE